MPKPEDKPRKDRKLPKPAKPELPKQVTVVCDTTYEEREVEVLKRQNLTTKTGLHFVLSVHWTACGDYNVDSDGRLYKRCNPTPWRIQDMSFLEEVETAKKLSQELVDAMTK